MKFSVILTTYGRPEFLCEAIDSVLMQTVQDFEVIIVDDASPVPVEVPSEDPRLRLVRRETNGGCTLARNTGLAHAVGENIVFLDDDDLYTSDRLELALEGLQRAPIAVCWQRFFDEAEAPMRRLDGDVHRVIAHGITPAMGATAIAYDAMIPFDERFRSVQDVEWWIRSTRVHHVATVPKVGYLVRQHAGERTGNTTRQRITDSRLLLDVHADYFAANPEAQAFRWRRIGLMCRKAGDKAAARRAFLRALRASRNPRDVKHLLTTVR